MKTITSALLAALMLAMLLWPTLVRADDEPTIKAKIAIAAACQSKKLAQPSPFVRQVYQPHLVMQSSCPGGVCPVPTVHRRMIFRKN